MEFQFEHRHASHCESGVMSSIIRHAGLPLSEPMAFGLSSALSFAYLPFIKLSGLPLVAYRMPPKFIIKGLSKPLSLAMHFETFRNPERGMARLDELLDSGKVVGLQTSVYWLPYFPADLRFHFNAHNLLVYGRDGDDYLISDPVFEEPVRCARADLQRARFAKGVLAPKGLLYYPKQTPREPEWKTAIAAAVKKTTRIMLWTPLPLIGVRGIRRMARAVESLPPQDVHRAHLFIGHLVRMQEEIGTGGAGFRFMYASFLQEAEQLTGVKSYGEFAERLIEIGDDWRQFALASARMVRGRDPLAPRDLAQLLRAQADREHVFFADLARTAK
ncbi:MAG: peptidase [Burkholderiales bacterium RIFCSPLOWO2_02_FULL_57_36]|nr:MAG: peptidase [Burkholderiales bacterium RIFCSPLOWO2_02_FULL_57_36]